MPARTGLSNLIGRLRGMTQAGTADYSIVDGSGGTVTWWSDDHLQTVLLQHMTVYEAVNLIALNEWDNGGTVHYYNYQIPVGGNLEEADSGTVYWQVQKTTGATVGTASYAVDYVAGIIRFTADQAGTAFTLRCRRYNLNRAAAQIWREKAAQAAQYYQFSTAGQSFSKQQYWEHCMEMSRYYDKSAGMTIAKRRRADLAQSPDPARWHSRHGPVQWPDEVNNDLDH